MTIPQIHELFLQSNGVSTDTRAIEEGQLFFALKGANFNGNKYANQALEAGASYAIIDEMEYQQPGKTILVGDVLHTLQQLANYHRQQFDIPVIAITGSNGKTTTKELMQSVLAEKSVVLATKGNLNNHIGVALTLLELSDRTEVAIIEMGANKKGDIRELCSFANPTHGLITNIGKAHLEGFGSFQRILETKTELYDFLFNSGGYVFLNYKEMKLVNSADRFKKDRVIPYQEGNEMLSTPKQTALLRVLYKEQVIQTQLTGNYNVDNVAAAIAVGEFFTIGLNDIKRGLESFCPANNRSQIVKSQSGSIIMDAYNANPFSMRVAVENLMQFEGQKVAILGDMFELGAYSAEEHKAIAELCERLGVVSFFCGEAFFLMRQQFPSMSFSKNREDLVDQLSLLKLEEGCHILIKGSRGMALEKLVEQLKF